MQSLTLEQVIAREVCIIKPSPIEVDDSEVISIRDKRFRLYNYFGHQVYQDIETGWLNAGKFVKAVAEIEGKDIDLTDFKATGDWKLALEFGRRVILEQTRKSGFASSSENSNENIEQTQGKKSSPASSSEIEAQILKIYGNEYLEAKGSYVPYRVFQLVALWADKRHKLEVLEFLQAVNENANAFNKDAYAVLKSEKEKLIAEVEALKSKIEHKNHSLDELEAELVSRADIIDEQNIIIDEYNKPFNQIDGTPSIYALAKDSSHFQLRVDPFGCGTNGIRNVKLINATFIRDEAINILKNESLVSSVNREYWIPIDKLDYAFNLINEIKNNTRIDIPTIEKRNEFIDKKLQTFRAGRKSTQTDGLIFEYETIKSHSSYIPWKLIPKAILNTYGEQRKDRGIDAVEIENNEITRIIQIKKHNGGYLRRDELQTFIAKCSQERYSKASKLLIVKNAKISNKLRRELADISIEIISIQ